MRFRVAADHPALPGHFPGRPIVPGVVILDHVQQAIEREHGAFAAPIRLAQVKFVQPLLPDEEAEIAIEAAARGWKFQVRRGDAVIASGDVAAA